MTDRLLSVRDLRVAFGNRIILRELSFEVSNRHVDSQDLDSWPDYRYRFRAPICSEPA